MIKEKIVKYRKDRDYRMLVNSFISSAITVAFAIYNGVCGILKSSKFQGLICIYYIILASLRIFLTLSERNIYRSGDRRREKIYFLISTSVSILINVALGYPIYLLVAYKKPIDTNTFFAVINACYATVKIVLASLNFKRTRRSNDLLIRQIKSLSFVDALVSIMSLQATLIFIGGGFESKKMMILSCVVDFTLWAFILIIVIFEAIYSIKLKIKG